MGFCFWGITNADIGVNFFDVDGNSLTGTVEFFETGAINTTRNTDCLFESIDVTGFDLNTFSLSVNRFSRNFLGAPLANKYDILFFPRFCYRTHSISIRIDDLYFFNPSIFYDRSNESYQQLVISAMVSATHVQQDSLTA